MSFYLKRDINIYVSTAATAGAADTTNTNKIKITDFNFNQSSISTNIARKTLGATSSRAGIPVVESVAEVDFSFTTYIQPFVITTVRFPDEYLWLSLMGSNTINRGASVTSVNFANGNVASLLPLTIWLEDPNNTNKFRLDSAVITSATIPLDIDSLGRIEWKGKALAIVPANTMPTDYTDRSLRTEFIKNRLSTLDLEVNGTSYTVALTGGELNITNEVDFYGRQPLGEVGTISGHQTGGRKIDGSLNLYLKSLVAIDDSLDLYTEILNNISSSTYEDTHQAVIGLNIGGTSNPYMKFTIPQATINIPQIGFEDVLTLSVPFEADESSGYCVVYYYA